MKTKCRCWLLSSGIQITLLAALLAFNGLVMPALGQGTTAFTYQGHFLSNGIAANGTNGMIFTLYNAATGGTSVGGPIGNSVNVSNGLFNVVLDFGAGPVNGSALWLDIAVSNGAAPVELSPRTQLLPTPYATYSASANFAAVAGIVNIASNFSGTTIKGSFTGNGGGLTNVGAALQMQVFATPGSFSFIVPTNVTSIIVEAWGGGGGGAEGLSTFQIGGGGGGAGGYAKAFYNVTPGASYGVVVGGGGAAEAAGGGSGFNGVILATGGAAGTAATTASLSPGGAGGTGPTSSSTVSGSKGGTGKYGKANVGGDGGDAACGGTGGLGDLGNGEEAGRAPGGGGGGNLTGLSLGGAGGNGEVIVYY